MAFRGSGVRDPPAPPIFSITYSDWSFPEFSTVSVFVKYARQISFGWQTRRQKSASLPLQGNMSRWLSRYAVSRHSRRGWTKTAHGQAAGATLGRMRASLISTLAGCDRFNNPAHPPNPQGFGVVSHHQGHLRQWWQVPPETKKISFLC